MRPYWILARDHLLRSAVLDSPDAFEKWTELAEPAFTVTLMHETTEIASLSPAEYVDVDELVEAVINIPSPDSPHKESFYQVYARGGCDIFAVALQRIMGGELYAVTDPIGDSGKRTRVPRPVPRQVYGGDEVIDIEDQPEE